jgi:hypothetical protein
MLHVNVSVFAETDVPQMGSFVLGSQINLGLGIENNGTKYYLVVNNPQDYENPSQRDYRFHVLGGTTRIDVMLSINNLDDEPPSFSLPPDSKTCEIRVSNALYKLHSLHKITKRSTVTHVNTLIQVIIWLHLCIAHYWGF